MSDCKILVVEDEEYIRESLCEILQMHGYRAVAVSNGEAGVELIKKEDYDIVLTDLKLPGMSGIDIIRSIKEISPDTSCIVLTGYASVESAVEAMRVGAHTYLQKPLNKDQLLVTIEKAREVYTLKAENTKLKDEIKGKYTDSILGTSPQVHKIRELIEKVADTDSTVLILGESGTGKELVARALHYCSSRSKRSFVPINCGAIPEDLLESELFGYEKGAFTGAIATKIGRFEAADRGTVFLDEIGEMSPALQVKILRVLQEKEFERVGGRETRKVDLRVVAATNQDLEKAVEEKRFREDLFYRLNVIPIHLPPLRARKEDVSVLVAEFTRRISESKNKTLKGVSEEAMGLLNLYDWPGNVRELENLIERLVVLKDDDEIITPDDLPEKIKRGNIRGEPSSIGTITLPPDGVDFNIAVHKFERDLILNALNRVDGVKKKAAEFLNLNRTTLIEKMKRMGLSDRLEN